jgi:hypothetical protein
VNPVSLTDDERQAFETAQARLRAILPEDYQDTYEDIQPVSMGSAGLKYGADGQVAWNEMWATFCDLAMAGGPPHKGTLLEPATRAAIDAQPDRHAAVVDEICRGVGMATGLAARPSPAPGWVRVRCAGDGMADWLLRAIVMENVAVRRTGDALDLPAGPDFRLEKEIKNVVTVISKTSHYWSGHMPRVQQRVIANLFAEMADESPLVEPAATGDAASDALDALSATIAAAILQATGLAASRHRYAGWLGVECASVRDAVWLMRALVVSNVLSRREGTALFVPIDPATDPGGEIVVRSLTRVHRLMLSGTRRVPL